MSHHRFRSHHITMIFLLFFASSSSSSSSSSSRSFSIFFFTLSLSDCCIIELSSNHFKRSETKIDPMFQNIESKPLEEESHLLTVSFIILKTECLTTLKQSLGRTELINWKSYDNPARILKESKSRFIEDVFENIRRVAQGTEEGRWLPLGFLISHSNAITIMNAHFFPSVDSVMMCPRGEMTMKYESCAEMALHQPNWNLSALLVDGKLPLGRCGD